MRARRRARSCPDQRTIVDSTRCHLQKHMLHLTVLVQVVQQATAQGLLRIQKSERAHVPATCTAYFLPSSRVMRSVRGSTALYIYIVLSNNVMYSGDQLRGASTDLCRSSVPHNQQGFQAILAPCS